MSEQQRIEELTRALQACLESLRLVEEEFITKQGGGKFAEWSHPAVSMRMADAALLGEREEGKPR